MANKLRKQDLIEKALILPFDENDLIWIGDTKFQACNSNSIIAAVHKYTDRRSQEGIFLGMNPAKEMNVIRNRHNVSKMRNLVLEFDDKLPLDEQIPFMKSKGIPYSLCTYSGGKSYHFMICLTDPITSQLKYEQLFNKLYVYLDELPDISMRDYSKFTRLPLGSRNGILQELKEFNRRINIEEIEVFFNDIAFKKKFIQSKHFVDEYEKKLLNVSVGDRKDFVESMKWYMNDYLDYKYDGKTAHVQCPVCASEGGDNGMDNLYVTGPEMSSHCFADPEEHNKQLMFLLMDLKTRWDEENNLKTPNFGGIMQSASDDDILGFPLGQEEKR